MKKFLGISLVLFMLVSMLSLSSFAADPTFVWDFGEGTDIESHMGANSAANALTWEAKDFYHIFTAGGNDPFVSMDFSADDVSQIIWCKARVYNPGPATAIELFGHTDGRGLSGPECTHINITPNTNEWKTYIIDISKENMPTVNAYKDPQYAITEFYWQGTVDWIRLDPMWQEGNDGSDSGGSMVSGDQIWIDYIAFFSNEADAIAYKGTEELRLEAEAAAAAAAATPEETTAAAETVAPAETTAPKTTPAAQTADIAAIAVFAAVLAIGTAVVIKKR